MKEHMSNVHVLHQENQVQQTGGLETAMSASISAASDTNGDSLSCASDETNDLNSISTHCISTISTMPTTSSAASPLVNAKVEVVHPADVQCSNEDGKKEFSEDNDKDTRLQNNSKISEIDK